jgi:hypothetical protein
MPDKSKTEEISNPCEGEVVLNDSYREIVELRLGGNRAFCGSVRIGSQPHIQGR